MPSREDRELARLLLAKGTDDLDALKILADAHGAADSVIGFHAQQAVEKFAKAVLAVRGVEVPRTHDLRFLFELADANGLDIPADVGDARWLTPWAVEFRYGEPLTDPLDRTSARRTADQVARWADQIVAGPDEA